MRNTMTTQNETNAVLPFKPMDKVAMPLRDIDGIYDYVPAIVTNVTVKDMFRNLVECDVVYLDDFLVVDATVSASDLRDVKDVKANAPRNLTRNLTERAFCELQLQAQAQAFC